MTIVSPSRIPTRLSAYRVLKTGEVTPVVIGHGGVGHILHLRRDVENDPDHPD